MNWYGSKRAVVARLDGLVVRLATAGVSPDAVTSAAIPVAVVGGVALLASPLVPPLLLLVPVLVAVRLILEPRRRRPGPVDRPDRTPAASCSTSSATASPTSRSSLPSRSCRAPSARPSCSA